MSFSLNSQSCSYVALCLHCLNSQIVQLCGFMSEVHKLKSLNFKLSTLNFKTYCSALKFQCAMQRFQSSPHQAFTVSLKYFAIFFAFIKYFTTLAHY